MALLVVALAASVAPASALAVSGTDTLFTIAGSTWGYSGEGGQATSARLAGPFGVAVDAAGNVYVADRFNHRVRRITPGGIIASVAGTGVAGYSGDGGLASLAQLNNPFDVTVDASGNVFVADILNHRVRKISRTGVITTVAGTGVAGYSVDSGPATAARLSYPYGVALDAQGNLLIVDAGNARIRRVDSNGTITTVAGNGLYGSSGDGGAAGAAELNTPSDVATDDAGNLYIADIGNDNVRKVDANGVITTFAGTGVAGSSGDGGPAVAARLNEPVRVAVDAAGNVYIADSANSRIRKVTREGVITTVAGTGVAGFSGDGGQATAAQLDYPSGLEVRSDGSLVFTDFNYSLVRVIQNALPTAALDTTLTGGESSLAVAFDASGSSDSNGSVAGYEWEFGDGQTATGRTVSHTYRNAGTFIAKLTVSDELGATASTTRSVTVSAPAPSVPAPQVPAPPVPAPLAPAAAPSATVSCGVRTATIVGTEGSDVLVGTAGVDVIVGLGGDDMLRGLGANDVLCGGRGNDRLTGGAGGDWLHGGRGRDWLDGGRGGDWLGGGRGNDRLSGGPGSDWLRGDQDDDQLSGGPGRDWLSGGRGNDTLDRATGDWLGGRLTDPAPPSRATPPERA
ncbi:MAG: PKD domain-containing protein [Solirubrobacteraceae bacterium]